MNNFVRVREVKLSLCYFRTSLMLAARCESKGLVSLLLQQGVDVLSEDSWGRTALSYAVDNGDIL